MKKISDFFSKISTWTKKHKTAFALIITIIFVLAQIPLLLNHEIWNDEAVSWGLSKRINLTNAYEVNAAEPHPLLWQFIIAPFSQNGFSTIAMNIIALVFVSAAVFLMVRFAPMGFFTKLLFILSSGFFYYNPVIARGYSLIPLAVTLVCIAYKKRHEKPFLYGLSLAFLTQTHFLMYGFAGALTIGFIIEETFKKEKAKKMIITILLCIVPVLLSVASTLPMVFGSFNEQAIITGKAFEYTSDEYRALFIPNAVATYFGIYNDALAWACLGLIIIAAIIVFAENIKVALYAFCGLGLWAYVLCAIYQGYSVFNQKVSIVVLILFAIVWLLILEKDDKRKNIISKFLDCSEIIKFLRVKMKIPATVILTFIVTASIPCVMFNAVEDLNKPFSNSKEVATFVNETIEDDALIILADPYAHYTFGAAAMEQITKNVKIYNIVFESFDSYGYQLQYSNASISKVQDYIGFTDAALAHKLADLSKGYEHVYYVVGIPSCKNVDSYNSDVLGNYEVITTLNEGDYLDVTHAPVRVHKIK